MLQAWWDKFVHFKVKRFSIESQAVLRWQRKTNMNMVTRVSAQAPSFSYGVKRLHVNH